MSTKCRKIDFWLNVQSNLPYVGCYVPLREKRSIAQRRLSADCVQRSKSQNDRQIFVLRHFDSRIGFMSFRPSDFSILRYVNLSKYFRPLDNSYFSHFDLQNFRFMPFRLLNVLLRCYFDYWIFQQKSFRP